VVLPGPRVDRRSPRRALRPGPPLVLVHGTAADHTRWASILGALEQRFTVHACDRRGRGGSPDTAPYAIEREFEDVAAVVDAIGGPVDLFGHSYGAISALEALVRARNLRRVVAYEPPLPTGTPIYPDAVVQRLMELLEAGDREGVVETFMTEVPRVPAAQLALMKTLPAWAGRVAAAHTIVRELHAHRGYTFDVRQFRGVTTPVLLLLGGASPAFFADAIELARSALPAARLAVLADQQHVAMDTAPELLLREVLGFLEAP
jgi:pimeloyl-ACP methyl ester carboxylesterase